MSRCIEIAKNGLGTTYPNPLVGSVIVSNDRIIGEGWHQRAGQPHAEVNAINAVKDKSLLKNATLYVNLEPCSHHGKTPPCAERILKEGIPRVVVGSMDPNPMVAGNGIKLLRTSGLEVTTEVLKDECDFLNKRFFTYHGKKRPYIILKWAQSSDGFLAPEKRLETAPVWITQPSTRQAVHKMRSEEMAILVGANTIAMDDPSLTTRLWSGKSPLRIVLTDQHQLSEEAKIFDGATETLIVQTKDHKYPNAQTLLIADHEYYLQEMLAHLYQKGIQSVIVEGGLHTLEKFRAANLWDESHIYIGKKFFEKGVKAPEARGKLKQIKEMGEDSLQIYLND